MGTLIFYEETKGDTGLLGYTAKCMSYIIKQ